MKKQPSEREKILANEATDKELIPKIYKELMQLNTKKKNQKMSKRPRHFSKDKQTAKKKTHEKLPNII